MATRRDLLKWGAFAGAAAAMPQAFAISGGKKSSGGTTTTSSSGSTSTTTTGGNRTPDNLQPSPPTTPFMVELPRMVDAVPCDPTSYTGAPISDITCISPEDAVQRSAKQAWNKFKPVKWYEIWERQNDTYSWHPQLPKQPIWGFNGMFPGPLIKTRHGEPVCVRWHNALPSVNKLGFGLPSTSTHLHNFHTASESDGFPTDYIDPGQFHDSHYTMCCPGWSTGAEDEREMLNTLWYHDHRMDFTSQNTYAGLVGMFLQHDECDSGDENDTNPNAYRLPSGPYDIPMVFADKAFNPSTGVIYFDVFNFDGMLGDKWTVNGQIQPRLSVAPRKYRFRLLVGGPSRFFQFKIAQGSPTGPTLPMVQVCQDGNFLNAPVTRQNILVPPAERVDVIVDFTGIKKGTSLYLLNIAEQMNGRGPTGNILPVGDQLMRIDVVLDPVTDNSRVPTAFRGQPPINLNEAVANRTWRFERSGGGWVVNGQVFDSTRVDAHVKQNTAEIWTIQNNSGSWSHPVHIHFEEFRILSRNGAPPPVWEQGRKDVIRLGPNEEVKIFMRFRDWTGRYPMHCHNTVHEDHAMMVRWDLE